MAAELIGEVPAGAVVLDAGGGTGQGRRLFPPGCVYLCADPDLGKVAAFASQGCGSPLVADGTRLPIASGTIDLVLCRSVSHHLTDDEHPRLVDEIARVLKPSGRLIYVEPVWSPQRPISRLLWRYDAGSHPRPEPVLRAALERRFQLRRWGTYAVHHRCILAEGSPLPPESIV